MNGNAYDDAPLTCLPQGDHLNFFGYGIDKDTLSVVEDAILRSERLHAINLGHNYIDDQGLAVLMTSISAKAASLVSLDLSSNRLRGDAVSLIANARKSLVSLTELNLRNNEILDFQMVELAEAACSDIPLEILDLGDQAAHFCSFFDVSLLNQLNRTKVCTLSLAGNPVADKHVLRAVYLGEQPFMQGEQLYQGELGEELIPYAGLELHGSLRSLDLSRCLQRNDDYYHIEVALARIVENSCLHTLNLSSNPNILQEREVSGRTPLENPTASWEPKPLSPSEVSRYISFAEALSTNNMLTKLDLSNTGLENPGMVRIAAALMRNCTLLDLDVADNYFDDDAVSALCNLFDTNTTLIGVSLGENEFSNDGIDCLVKALEDNDVLQRFELLYDNRALGDGVLARIATKLEKNKPARSFTISCSASTSDQILVSCVALSGQEHELRMDPKTSIQALQELLASTEKLGAVRIALFSSDGQNLQDLPADTCISDVLLRS